MAQVALNFWQNEADPNLTGGLETGGRFKIKVLIANACRLDMLFNWLGSSKQVLDRVRGNVWHTSVLYHVSLPFGPSVSPFPIDPESIWRV